MAKNSHSISLDRNLKNAQTSFDAGNFAETRVLCRTIFLSLPKHPDANYWCGVSLLKLDLVEDAFPHLQNALRVNTQSSKYLRAYLDGLTLLFHSRKYDLLVLSSKFLTEHLPREGQGWHMLGVGLSQKKMNADAITALRHAHVLLPENPFILCSLGNALSEVGHKEEAITEYDKAIALKPDFAIAYNNRGNAQKDILLRDEALASYSSALAIKPDYAEVYCNMGVLYKQKNQFDDAIISFQKAIAIDPNLIEAYHNLSPALRAVGRVREALATSEYVLQRNPERSEYWCNYGDALVDSFRLDDAIQSYIHILSMGADNEGRLNRQAFSTLFFYLNYHPDLTAEAIYDAYCDYENRFGAPQRVTWTPFLNSKIPGRKLKIGYVSAAFASHPCKHFLAPLLEHHQHLDFDIYAYAEINLSDDYTEQYKKSFDHWLVTSGMSDQRLAERIRADQIDVLIDVSGHTGGNRLGVFAMKPAPVSLHWLDFGYTTGLKAIDYYLTDHYTVPTDGDHLFSEKPWRLPGTAYAYRPGEGMGNVSSLPAEKNGYVSFGTLTRAVRINYRTVRVWSAILKAAPNSRLIIDSGNFKSTETQEAMAALFIAQGINRERLEIGFHSPPWDTLRRIDIGLDCFPHNSGTTLFETLYMGVPFVTLAGRPSVGRLGASVLHGLGHSEWIAYDEAEYVQKALVLASDLPRLAQYRRNLRQEMQASVLMDEIGFARSVEEAYRQMWRQYCEKGEQT